MTLFRIAVSNSFDFTTEISSSNAKIVQAAGLHDTYDIVAPDLSPLADVGAIPWSFIFQQGLTQLPGAYIPRVGLSADGVATSFRVVVAANNGSNFQELQPTRTGSPVGATGGSVGPFAITSQDEFLLVTSNGTGSQILTIEAVPMVDSRVIDMIGSAFTPTDAQPPIIIPMFLDNLESSGAATYRLIWPADAPTSTLTRLNAVSNAAVAGGSLTLTTSINGVAVTNGVVTIPIGAAGSSNTATPTANNVISNGNAFLVTVGGTNTTSGGDGTLVAVFEPLT